MIANTFRKKIQIILKINPKIQYPLHWVSGSIKQLKSICLPRNIGYTGNQPFLFIVGSGRSGNTLLRKLLMEYGDIYMPPESYVLGQEVITHLNACALSWSDKVDLTLAKFEFYPEFGTFRIDTLRDFSIYAKGFKKNQQQIGTLIYEFYKWIAEQNKLSSVWHGDKTPINTMNLGLINKLFPNAVYLYIERDGVDVCASYVKAGIYKNLADAAYRWKNSRIAWHAFKKNIPCNSYIEIQYEAMVNNAEGTISDILSAFEIPVRNNDKNILDSLSDISMTPHLGNVKIPPNISSIGKGRSSISEHDRLILKSIIGNELENAGYKSI